MADMKKKKAAARKPKPEYLGTGAAAKAASAFLNRRKQNCAASGGKWNSKANRCDW